MSTTNKECVGYDWGKYLRGVAKKLKDGGITHFVVVANDFKNSTDFIHFQGSDFWKMGVGQHLIDDANEGLSDYDEDEPDDATDPFGGSLYRVSPNQS